MAEIPARILARTHRDGDCLIWDGGRFGSGYGVSSLSGHASRRVHRIVWEVVNEATAPADREVLHSCDRKLCIEPTHLSLDTHTANMREASERGLLRQPRACGHPASAKWLMSNGRWRCRPCHAEGERRRKVRADSL